MTTPMRDNEPGSDHRTGTAPTVARVGVIDEAAAVIRANVPALAAALGAVLLSYGYALTTFSISIDEEIILAGQPSPLPSQGRPVIEIVNAVFGDPLPLPYLDLALALASLFAGAVIWALLLVRASRRSEGIGAGLFIYLVVFVTIPLNAHWLHFNIQNVAMGLAYVGTAASGWCAWLWVVEGRGSRYAVAAVALAVVAILAYQGFAFVVVGGLLVALIAARLTERDRAALAARAGIRRALLLVAPAAAALMIAGVYYVLFVSPGDYTQTFLGWGSRDVTEVLQELGIRVGRLAVGRGFVNGWVLFPSMAAAILLAILLVRRGLRRHDWLAFVLLVIVGVSPFALSVALGSALPTRALLGLPLVAASVWLLLVLALPARREFSVALVAVAALLAVSNAGGNTRLFLTEQLTYERDRDVAGQVAERLVDAGWDGEPIPIATIGALDPVLPASLTLDEIFGESFFGHTGGERAARFMQVIGYPLQAPDAVARSVASSVGPTLPAWPAAGSVVIVDGVAIVNFGEPPERG